MNIQTCSFVPVSEVFNGSRKTAKFFSAGEYDFTWGANNRSLITKERLLEAIESLEDVDTTKVVERIKSLPDDVYIDLEN